ncbi:MAG: hypothetical protein ABFS42_16995 [Candidatus Krumholzibacteriota bacterium]
MDHVLVTTEHRGVFFGELSADQNREAKSLTLKNCRNVIMWSGKNGFLGLAADGPEPESRIGSTAPSVLLHGVTSVSECTDKAAEVFRSWSA